MAKKMKREDEIAQLYHKIHGRMLAYSYSVLRNYALAEEAVQIAFCIACSKPDSCLDCANPAGWMFNTLKFTMLDMKRKYAKMNELIIKIIQSGQWETVGHQDEIDVDVLYSDLTDQQAYQLIKSVVLEQKTMLEISNELGIKVSACRKRVQRAKKLLQKKLQENEK